MQSSLTSRPLHHPQAPPYSVSLPPDEARAAAASGCSLLLLDVPPGTIVGIDHRSFIAGPNFKGVKMIPVVGKGGGAHFVASNAIGKRENANSSPSPSSSSPIGPTNFFFFHASTPGSVLIRRWSPEHEVLVPLEDEDEVERYKAGVRNFDFDAGLAPYDFSSLGLWRSLTRFISPKTTARMVPRSSKVVAMSVVAEADEVERTRKGKGNVRVPTEAEKKLDEQLASGRAKAGGGAGADASADAAVPDVVGAPRYVQLPRHAIVSGGGGSGRGRSTSGDGSGEEKLDQNDLALPPPPPLSSLSLLTAANLDKTSTLQAVVASPPFNGDAQEFLGEFQHAFVSFWAGHSLLAFGAWKDCLGLGLSCEAGFCLPVEGSSGGGGEDDSKEVDGAFFVAFVDALAAQLEVATVKSPPSSASDSSSAAANTNSIVDDLLDDSFLKKTARRFLENVREASEENGVDFLRNDEGRGEMKKLRLPPPSPELLSSCARLSRVLEHGLGWVGLGKPRVKQLRIGGEGCGRRERRSEDDSESDDSDGPVVVLDVERGY